MLGYNPEGPGCEGANQPSSCQHGYLWWLAWLGHEVRTLFSMQDANGVYRPIFLELNCASYGELLGFSPAATGLLAPVIQKSCNLP
jgi:hypothetical protein